MCGVSPSGSCARCRLKVAVTLETKNSTRPKGVLDATSSKDCVYVFESSFQVMVVPRVHHSPEAHNDAKKHQKVEPPQVIVDLELIQDNVLENGGLS